MSASGNPGGTAREPGRDRRARSFGEVADAYERGRPGYPADAVAWILGTRPLRVLDLGAGTGKLTQALAAAGHEVVAVEPLAQMRELLQRSLPSVEVLDGRAESLPLADASVDAVTVAAAFHWFDAGPALEEIARVLRPPGVLALLGNVSDVSVPWVAALRQILGAPAIENPGHWPSADALTAMFDEAELRRFPYTQELDLEGLCALALSRSDVATLPPEGREEVLEQVRGLWRARLDSPQAATLPWITIAGRCRGLSGAGGAGSFPPRGRG